MTTNRTYKYADELVEGDIIARDEPIKNLPIGQYETEQVWYMVHKPRKTERRPSFNWADTTPSPEGVTGMLLPVDGARKPVLLEGWATRLFEVATIESHPEVLQQLVDQITDLQAEQEPPADTQCPAARWSEPLEGPPELLFYCQLAAGHKEAHDGISGEYRMYWFDVPIEAKVVHDDDPDADELPKAQS